MTSCRKSSPIRLLDGLGEVVKFMLHCLDSAKTRYNVSRIPRVANRSGNQKPNLPKSVAVPGLSSSP